MTLFSKWNNLTPISEARVSIPMKQKSFCAKGMAVGHTTFRSSMTEVRGLQLDYNSGVRALLQSGPGPRAVWRVRVTWTLPEQSCIESLTLLFMSRIYFKNSETVVGRDLDN